MSRVGELLKSKKGALYLKFSNPKKDEKMESFEVQDGDVLFLKKPEDYYKGLADAGVITDEKATEIISKLPHFVKFFVEKGK